MAARYYRQFSILKDEVEQLDFYYLEARYPNAIEDIIPADFYNDFDAEKAIEMTGMVIEKIRIVLDKDSHD